MYFFVHFDKYLLSFHSYLKTYLTAAVGRNHTDCPAYMGVLLGRRCSFFDLAIGKFDLVGKQRRLFESFTVVNGKGYLRIIAKGAAGKIDCPFRDRIVHDCVCVTVMAVVYFVDVLVGSLPSRV